MKAIENVVNLAQKGLKTSPVNLNPDKVNQAIKQLEGFLGSGVKIPTNIGKNFSPREILNYQIKASNYQLRVELVSKTADTVSSTVRKLEQS